MSCRRFLVSAIACHFTCVSDARGTLRGLAMRRATITLTAALVALAAGRAGAQTLDLYQGTVMGSPRIVAMGGTVAAVSEDMTATLATPAAMAFRPAGATGWWDWDFYADTLLASRDTDLTNSGLPASPDRPVSAGAGGVCMYFGKVGHRACPASTCRTACRPPPPARRR